MLALLPAPVHRPPSCRRAVGRCRSTQGGDNGRPTLPHTPPPRAPPSSSGPEKRGDGIDIDLFEPAGTEEDTTGRRDPSIPTPNLHPLARLLESVDWSEPGTFDGIPKTEYDPLRDGPLRYLGYANEVGEAFGAWLFSGGVPLSYAIAISYVLFDTVDKWQATYRDARAKLSGESVPSSVDVPLLVHLIALDRGLDTLVWQLIASVAAPGYTIHTLVAVVTQLLVAAEATSLGHSLTALLASALNTPEEALLPLLTKSLPTAVGLATIPYIVHPIDSGVHALLNATLRPLLKRGVCSRGGAEAGLAICKPNREGR
ncbi:hypothetical protein ACKKBF_B32685 [Auxenochlorella protothecoides x Auxenochlorella symbiontica]